MTKRDVRVLDPSQMTPEFLKPNWTWVFPQISSWFAELPLKTVDWVVSPTQTLELWKNLPELDRFKTFYLWTTKTIRSETMMGGQTSYPRWSSATPFILSSFREHRGVDYSSWDWSDPQMKHFVDGEIWDSYCDPKTTWNREELIQFRTEALIVRTGAKQGTTRKSTSFLPWGSVGDPNFKSLSKLTKPMLTQTWLYHPQVRHPLMICDWDNVDHLPLPLVEDQELWSPRVKKEQKQPTQQPTFEEIFGL